jgi:hypothetical protein
MLTFLAITAAEIAIPILVVLLVTLLIFAFSM